MPSLSRRARAAIVAQAQEVIRAEPDQILEFVMDIYRYAEIDAKIRPISWAHRDGNLTEFRCRSKVGGVPGPKVVQQLRLAKEHLESLDLD